MWKCALPLHVRTVSYWSWYNVQGLPHDVANGNCHVSRRGKMARQMLMTVVTALTLLALLPSSSALTAMPGSVQRPLRRGGSFVPLVMQAEEQQQSVADKQMSSPELITYAGLNDEWQPLVKAALIRLDRNRVMQGKPKYDSIDGMTSAYIDQASDAGLGWTRQDAESEVVRYLMRQALADEGGIDGDAQDKSAFALLGLLLLLGVYSGLSSIGALDAFT